jgi:manganese/iron transport system permease protein
MGVVFSGMFGLGIVLYIAVDSNVHLDHILFGNMLGVERQELWQAGVISGAVALTLALKWRDWLLHSFDPAQARACGLAVGWLHYGLLALISLTVVATLNATGLILAIALMIAPGATAFLLAREFRTMLWVAVLVCMGSMLLGTYASFFLDSAPAPTIVLVLTAVFLAVFARRLALNRRRALHRPAEATDATFR